MDQPGRHRVVGIPIDEDEPAHVTVLPVGVEGDGLVEMYVADPYLVQLEGSGCGVLECVDIDLVLGPVDGHPGGSGTELEQIWPPGQHLILGHPDDVSFELVGYRW